MFRKMIEKLKSLSTGDGERFDPATLDDPVALKTEWTPLKRGGASFCTRHLVRISPLRYEFCASWGAKAFYLIFLVIGLGLLVTSISQVIMGESFFTKDVIALGAVGLVFTLAGGLMFYFGTRPVVFDKQHNCFWKGKISDDELIYATANELLMPFQEIHSIQLISELIRSKNSSYFSYEMNLISQEGVRTNVIDHGNLDQVHEDARTLSEFLEVPIWDGI